MPSAWWWVADGTRPSFRPCNGRVMLWISRGRRPAGSGRSRQARISPLTFRGQWGCAGGGTRARAADEGWLIASDRGDSPDILATLREPAADVKQAHHDQVLHHVACLLDQTTRGALPTHAHGRANPGTPRPDRRRSRSPGRADPRSRDVRALRLPGRRVRAYRSRAGGCPLAPPRRGERCGDFSAAAAGKRRAGRPAPADPLWSLRPRSHGAPGPIAPPWCPDRLPPARLPRSALPAAPGLQQRRRRRSGPTRPTRPAPRPRRRWLCRPA